jgi:hypothetical protein
MRSLSQVLALQFLLHNGIVYGNLKPATILIDDLVIPPPLPPFLCYPPIPPLTHNPQPLLFPGPSQTLRFLSRPPHPRPPPPLLLLPQPSHDPGLHCPRAPAARCRAHATGVAALMVVVMVVLVVVWSYRQQPMSPSSHPLPVGYLGSRLPVARACIRFLSNPAAPTRLILQLELTVQNRTSALHQCQFQDSSRRDHACAVPAAAQVRHRLHSIVFFVVIMFSCSPYYCNILSPTTFLSHLAHILPRIQQPSRPLPRQGPVHPHIPQ